MLTEEKYRAYTALLNSELQLASGCTEPIAIAYCAAYAKKLLGESVGRCVVRCSGNMIKNAMAVVVPQTGGRRGIETAALAGIIFGDPDKKLEVLNTESAERGRGEIDALRPIISVELLESRHALHIITELYGEHGSVSVEIIDQHTGIGRVVKNGEVLHETAEAQSQEESRDFELLNLADIVEYADAVALDDVRATLERQIERNMLIAAEGLRGDWGESVGKTLLAGRDDLRTRMRALAAAGSDARMNGCPLPVVINCGSGNQGITASVPVAVYAEAKGFDRDRLLRALCCSNLIAMRQKACIGRLSAYCGAVCAAAGAAAGIAYLDGCRADRIGALVSNTVCAVGGMVCDGAKSSCAGKIALALEAALLGYDMAAADRAYRPGEGLVGADAEQTVNRVGRMASAGMRATDTEILNIMLGH